MPAQGLRTVQYFPPNEAAYPGGMLNLIIGFCVGLLTSLVLIVMWRVVSHLDEQIDAKEREAANDRARRGDPGR